MSIGVLVGGQGKESTKLNSKKRKQGALSNRWTAEEEQRRLVMLVHVR